MTPAEITAERLRFEPEAPSLSQEELGLLLGLGEQLVAELQLEAVLAKVAEYACSVVQAETLVVPMIDSGGQGFTYRAGSGKLAPMIVGHSFPIHEGACGWVLHHERPLLFGEGSEFAMDASAQWQPGMASSLLVPLICRGTIIGGLSAMGKLGGGPFNRRDLTVLTLFANQAGIAIDNARVIQELRGEKEKAEVTLNSIADAVLTTDTAGRISYVNMVATQLCERPAAELIGHPLLQRVLFIDGPTREPLDPIHYCLSEGHTVSLAGHPSLIGARGSEVGIECTTSPIHDDRGEVIGVVMVLHDVTEKRRLQSELSFKANFDDLTGLANRWRFKRALTHALEDAHTSGAHHALLYMDLDQFKIVNDTCGHLAGDALLQEVATTIHDQTRKSDLLARLGGDEFGLLLLDCDDENARKIAFKIIERVRRYRFVSHNREFKIGISIGMARISSHSRDLEQLLSQADIACYAAKEKGGNRLRIYDPSNAELERREGEMHWVPRLRSALSEDRFALFIQPIVPIQSGSGLTTHHEVLLRMRDEEGRLVEPGLFIQAAERYRMITEIDRWTFDHVIVRLRQPDTPPSMRVCVNLSGASLGSRRFRAHLLQQIADAALPPGTLCLEITETSAVENLMAAAEFIEQLRTLGCATALDDFGSGLCSFGYLKELPVDYLKIDGSLVRRVAENELDLGMVEAINNIGHLLGKKTIAEWVEGDATCRRLQEIGVDYVQGFALGVPEPWE